MMRRENDGPHPEVFGAISAFTRVFDATWRRASKDGSSGAAACILRGSLTLAPQDEESRSHRANDGNCDGSLTTG
jgi:hypothetical protein